MSQSVSKAKMSQLIAHERRLDARSKPLAQAMAQWLARYARLVVERELSRRVRKADDEQRLQRELEQILRLYGVRQMTDAAHGTRGGNWQLPPSAIDAFLEQKVIQVTGLARDTRQAIRDDIRRVLREALSETPQPSAGEVARRIRSSYFGPEDARPFAVSSERAALIARTELVQAENTGIVEGYKASGVEEIEWLAYSDGKSGDRHHEDMNGERVKLGEYFVTPLGNKLRYPGDPAAPIKETANCRCTVAPVRRKA